MSEALVEGVDYTIDPETGYLVFTREYLLKRGFCCANGCRHCPYDEKPNEDDDPEDKPSLGIDPKAP